VSGVLRLLVVCPSWVGDAVMATPTFRLLREHHRGAFIGALVRPGIDQVLAGTRFFDEVHVERASGVMGPKFVAAKLRPRRYDTALLLTNSFSTALTARIAGVPRRIGYDRDARGLLLTHRMDPPRNARGGYACVPALDYYLALARRFLLDEGPGGAGTQGERVDSTPGPRPFMELATTPEEEALADAVLARAGVTPGTPFAVLNPGGNNDAKRWPAERFARVAGHLADRHALRCLVNGAPAEAAVVDAVVGGAAISNPALRPAALHALGGTLGSLKAIVRRARLMVTNDTGPRHIAAAFGVPLVSLFGPTDPRWTTIPTRPGAPEAVLVADPTLPAEEIADDHPERCRVERISVERVIEAVEGVLAGSTERA
jgi:heptosyltransferase-2